MTKELNVVAGLCYNGHEMEHRMVREETIFLITGLCGKCKTLIVLKMFLKHKENPIQDVDYTIDFNIKSEKGVDV